MLKPIWDAFSRENMLKSIFPKESPQIMARKWLQMKTTIVPLRPTTPKRASANERAIKKGGGGHPPATLCVRAFSRESLDPRPGPGGKPTPQVLTCAGPHPDHLPGAARYYVPFGWPGLFPTLGRSAPGGPACPAGVPISPEKWGERGPGLRPWTPGFDGRSFPLASFCRGCL